MKEQLEQATGERVSGLEGIGENAGQTSHEVQREDVGTNLMLDQGLEAGSERAADLGAELGEAIDGLSERGEKQVEMDLGL